MPHVSQAWDWLFGNIDLFKKHVPKSMLYVGHRYDTKLWWYDRFGKKLGIERYGIIDIWRPNLTDAELRFSMRDEKFEFILGDVRELQKHVTPGKYDMIFWDGGPEHVDEHEVGPATELFKSLGARTILYFCPWGEWKQGPEDGNHAEIHRFDVFPELFVGLGMTAVTFNTRDQIGSGEICAYWFAP